MRPEGSKLDSQQGAQHAGSNSSICVTFVSGQYKKEIPEVQDQEVDVYGMGPSKIGEDNRLVPKSKSTGAWVVVGSELQSAWGPGRPVMTETMKDVSANSLPQLQS